MTTTEIKKQNKDEADKNRKKMESIKEVIKQIEEFTHQQMEYEEKTLAEIIEKYDFVVGSKECKCKLMEVLPEGANVICLPYIENPTTIYAIKKFDTMDLLFEPQESEEISERNMKMWEEIFKAERSDKE